MATISACAVGSFVRVTRFVRAAMMRFPLTISAANGPPLPERTFSSASAMARLMNSGDIALSFFRSSECTVRVKFATRHFSGARNHLTPRPHVPASPPDLQVFELAGGWCIGLRGFALIFIHWRRGEQDSDP